MKDITKLNIINKQDNSETIAATAHLLDKEKLKASEVNDIVAKINELVALNPLLLQKDASNLTETEKQTFADAIKLIRKLPSEHENAKKLLQADGTYADLTQTVALNLPTVEVMAKQDFLNKKNDRKFRIFIKIHHATPEIFDGKEYQLWIYRHKGRKHIYRASKKYDFAYRRWSHINGKREGNDELGFSNFYSAAPGETRKTEFNIPYFNEWFELTEFNHFAWWSVMKKVKLPDGTWSISSSDLAFLGSNIPADTPTEKYYVKPKGQSGKTIPIRFGFALKYIHPNYGVRFIEGTLSPVIRLGIDVGFGDMIYTSNYIPVSRDEIEKRFNIEI